MVFSLSKLTVDELVAKLRQYENCFNIAENCDSLGAAKEMFYYRTLINDITEELRKREI